MAPPRGRKKRGRAGEGAGGKCTVWRTSSTEEAWDARGGQLLSEL